MKAQMSFNDVSDNSFCTVTVNKEFAGVSINVPGYGTYDMGCDYGPVVLLEMRNGIPFVVIWADIKSQEPTHVISLAKASEKLQVD